MLMGRKAWLVDGVELPLNPSSVMIDNEKDVTYAYSVSGMDLRYTPPKRSINRSLILQWSSASEKMRDYLYDIFSLDTKVELTSHCFDEDPSQEWTVKVDSLDTTYLNSNRGKRFSITAHFEVMDANNDPIVERSFPQTPALFPIENKTNQDIYRTQLFIYSDSEDIVNPKIVLGGNNLLYNPIFSDVDLENNILKWNYRKEFLEDTISIENVSMMGLAGFQQEIAVDSKNLWKPDVIMFLDGNRCMGVSMNWEPIYQDMYCPPNEKVSLGYSIMAGDDDWIIGVAGMGSSFELEDTVRCLVRVEFLSKDNEVLGLETHWRDVGNSWQDFTYTTANSSPEGTMYARISFMRISGTNKLFLGRVSAHLFSDAVKRISKIFPNNIHSDKTTSLHYNGTIPKGDILKIDLDRKLATINDEEIIQVAGNWGALPAGKGLLVCDSDNGDSVNVVVKFEEEWV